MFCEIFHDFESPLAVVPAEVHLYLCALFCIQSSFATLMPFPDLLADLSVCFRSICFVLHFLQISTLVTRIQYLVGGDPWLSFPAGFL